MKSDKLTGLLFILGLGASSFAGSLEVSPAATVDQLVPALPYVMDYEFFDHFYTQNLEGNRKYSEIQAYVKDNGGKPHITIKLVEKGTGTPVVYADQIQYVPPSAYIPKAITGFAFRDKAGQPVRWRFTLAYPPSAQGSGLTTLPNAPDLKLIYRDSGSLSDAGSAVDMGGKVSEVQIWREISQPPYFIAYQGTYTEGAETTQLRTDLDRFELNGFTGLKPGSQFQLVTVSGKLRRLSVEAQTEGLMLRQSADENGISRELMLTSDQQGYAIRSLRVLDGSHSSNVAFTPPLRLLKADSDGPASQFQITAEKNHKVGTGWVHLAHTPNGAQLIWKVNSPGWAKNRTIVQTLAVSHQGVAVAMIR